MKKHYCLCKRVMRENSIVAIIQVFFSFKVTFKIISWNIKVSLEKIYTFSSRRNKDSSIKPLKVWITLVNFSDFPNKIYGFRIYIHRYNKIVYNNTTVLVFSYFLLILWLIIILIHYVVFSSRDPVSVSLNPLSNFNLLFL